MSTILTHINHIDISEFMTQPTNEMFESVYRGEALEMAGAEAAVERR